MFGYDRPVRRSLYVEQEGEQAPDLEARGNGTCRHLGALASMFEDKIQFEVVGRIWSHQLVPLGVVSDLTAPGRRQVCVCRRWSNRMCVSWTCRDEL